MNRHLYPHWIDPAHLEQVALILGRPMTPKEREAAIMSMIRGVSVSDVAAGIKDRYETERMQRRLDLQPPPETQWHTGASCL